MIGIYLLEKKEGKVMYSHVLREPSFILLNSMSEVTYFVIYNYIYYFLRNMICKKYQKQDIILCLLLMKFYLIFQ